MKPAIVAVGYNRPSILKRLLNSLSEAKYETDGITLIISLDKASNEEEVVKVAEEFSWEHGEKIVRRFPERQGLRKHIIQCGDLSEKYGAVIILEDDLMVAPDFYSYVCAALEFYKESECVTGIGLYSHEWNGYSKRNFTPVADQYDTYLGQYSITWGQCWTYDWWMGFKKWYLEHEDKLTDNPKIPMNINHWSERSWGKYFVNYIVEQDKYYVIPRMSRSTNCSDLGEHVTVADNVHQVRLMTGGSYDYRFAPVENAQRYDIYFENMKLCEYFDEDIRNEGLVVDLAGHGRNTLGARYLLSSRCLPYHIVKSYGLQLRPCEMNVINNIPGNDIFLYDTKSEEKNNEKNDVRVMRYEIRGFSARDLLPYVKALLVQKIKNKLHKKR